MEKEKKKKKKKECTTIHSFMFILVIQIPREQKF